jgi:hypothetical protein
MGVRSMQMPNRMRSGSRRDCIGPVPGATDKARSAVLATDVSEWAAGRLESTTR